MERDAAFVFPEIKMSDYIAEVCRRSFFLAMRLFAAKAEHYQLVNLAAGRRLNTPNGDAIVIKMVHTHDCHTWGGQLSDY